MKTPGGYFFCCVFLLALDQGLSLRCRTGNQQSGEHFHKVMELCRKRHSGRNYHSDESDSSDESSDSSENVFGNKLLATNNTYGKNPDENRNTEAGDNQGHEENHRRLLNSRFHSSDVRYDGTETRMKNVSINSSATNSSFSKTRNDGMNNTNDDQDPDQSCVIQCFFDELNLVDHRGFPDRSSVTAIMVQNIQDPELRDFVEESVTSCFQFLESDAHKEKCKFSQNLLRCLADKGKEKCDDWDEPQ
ncbi:general odorant-binding protein 71 [Orussus abietinus]|uniref:general odorant-binding protein 71 n=1 Tax=Orussus abietinus TaxID=222816 RepID=UPI00062571AB|nr:general odorant-binding protein 71 [Orussus abietinus]XP_023288822.1 general odorant-binding protein 71 [Orussus abietinus]XP_023288823.1 general odorant-binding protein 71 [Orussus abietinus]